MTEPRNGSAMIIVMLAIALLFSLGVPFLLSGKLRSEASRETFDRSRVRLAAVSASTFSSAQANLTHPSFDVTPLWDASEEWDLSAWGPLPESLGESFRDTRQSWGLEIEAAQSRVSLATAPPMLLQNLVHPCFITRDSDHQETEFFVTSTAGFPEEGLLFINGNWIQYGDLTPNSFANVLPDPDPPEDPDANRFREGTMVLDPRVYALALSRFQSGSHKAPEFLTDMLDFPEKSDFGAFSAAELRSLKDQTWIRSGSFGSGEWEPAVWQIRTISEERPDLITVSDGYAFSPGAVVRIEPEGSEPFETLVLWANPGRGLLMVANDLPGSLVPLTTRLRPLRREPVDINSASPRTLEALVLGLRLRNNPVTYWAPPEGSSARQNWITPSDARRFSAAVLHARPLQGPEDLWARVIRPLIDQGTWTWAKGLMIHLNGLDPNDGSLRQSTTAYAYRSGDRYLHRVDAALRSRTGRTLARSARFEEFQTVPDGPLLRVWSSQEDFEDLGSWSRGLHGTTTYPGNLGSFGGHHRERAGLTLRTGTWDPTGIVVASKDSDISGVIPLPARETDALGPNSLGRTEHFDLSPDPLGWDVAIHGPQVSSVGSWLSTGELSDVEPLAIQGWLELLPVPNGSIFDISGASTERNRVWAGIEAGEIVIKAWDPAGEDPFDESRLDEALEWRLDPTDYPVNGRWVHLSALLRGVSPRGFQMAVDGVPRGESNCFTTTTAPVSGFAPGDSDEEVVVESTEGFPQRGAIRIGDEVIEYSSKTETTFVTARVPGPNDYLGGRAARGESDVVVAASDTNHPMGSGVELYGYSSVLASDIPPGGGTLSGSVGPFSLACPINGPDTVTIMHLSGNTTQLGQGISGDYLGDLELGEMAAGDPYFSECFQEDGGYALLFQRRTFWGWQDGAQAREDQDGFRLGGFEIIRYSSRTGNTISISERSVMTPGTEGAPEGVYDPNGTSFVTEWESSIYTNEGEALMDLPEYRLFVMPISMKGLSVTDTLYLTDIEYSGFVQLTTRGDSALTEWVRYDNILNGCFVRDDWTAIANAVGTYNISEALGAPPPESPASSPGAPPPGPSAGGAPEGAGRAIPQDPDDDYQFTRTIGEPIPDRDPAIELISKAFQFRGVLGTFDHAQTAEANFIPVFRTLRRGGPWGGYPGRLDRVAVMQPETADIPTWFTVEWGAVARRDDANNNDPRVHYGSTYVAFTENPGLPFLQNSDEIDWSSSGIDVRRYARLSKFPSGERPLSLTTVSIGGDLGAGAGPFPGRIDEFALHAPGGMGAPVTNIARGNFVLEEDLDESENSYIELHPYALHIDGVRFSSVNSGDWLATLPTSGLIDIDGERIAYMDVDIDQANLVIAPDGRGMHGTVPKGHASGTSVNVVDSRPVAALSSSVSAGSSVLQIESNAGFHTGALLLVGEELIHAPQTGMSPEGGLLMPRMRPEVMDPDDLGAGGNGILRGRFGTTASGHAAGALVTSFPTRWEDRYIPRSDSPAGAWFQIGLEEPEAWWKGVLFEAEIPDPSLGVRLLARAPDVAKWTDDPDVTPAMKLIDRGRDPDGGPVPLGFSADRLEMRLMFDWDTGAFDPIDFLYTGWTQAPRVRRILVDYIAESRVNRLEEIEE
ncbi:MAG TPA: hypothetical protein DDW23_01360 [Planctomycetes bacterium]|nr:hypothetical protein [Planctomycetota bacterium]